MNLRDQIAAAKDTQLVPVEVPEWGCQIFIRELSLGDRLRLWDAIADEANKDKIHHVYTVIFCVTDEAGTPVFSLDDYDLVASKNHDVILRLGKHAAEVNKLLAGAVDDAKKN